MVSFQLFLLRLQQGNTDPTFASFTLIGSRRQVAIIVQNVTGVTSMDATAVGSPGQPETKLPLNIRMVRENVLIGDIVPPRVSPFADVSDSCRCADIVEVPASGPEWISSRAIGSFQNGNASFVFFIDQSAFDLRTQLAPTRAVLIREPLFGSPSLPAAVSRSFCAASRIGRSPYRTPAKNACNP